MELSAHDKLMINHFFEHKPVKRAYVFGSYSRNEASQHSDLDLLIELDHNVVIGMLFYSYQSELEKLLNKKVDLISMDGLSPYIKQFIDKDKILIYEGINYR